MSELVRGYHARHDRTPDTDDRPRAPRRRDHRHRRNHGQVCRRGRPRGVRHVDAGRERGDRRSRAGHPREPRAAGRDPEAGAGARAGAPRPDRASLPGVPQFRDDGDPAERRPARLLAGRPRRGDRSPGAVGARGPAARAGRVQRLRRLRAPRPHPGGPGRERRLCARGRPELVSRATRGAGSARAVAPSQAVRGGVRRRASRGDEPPARGARYPLLVDPRPGRDRGAAAAARGLHGAHGRGDRPQDHAHRRVRLPCRQARRARESTSPRSRATTRSSRWAQRSGAGSRPRRSSRSGSRGWHRSGSPRTTCSRASGSRPKGNTGDQSADTGRET